MFEQKIQFAWEDYIKDFALGRLVLVSFSLNVFLFFLGVVGGELSGIPLIPLALGLVIFLLREKIVKLKDWQKFLISGGFSTVSIILCYIMVGVIDELEEALTRYDYLLANFDMYIFGMPIANWIESFFQNSSLAFLFYDFVQLSYLTYFLFPILGGILYYRQLPYTKHFKIGRFIGSVMIYFKLNYLIYLLIPVSGPQFFQIDYFPYDLPLSSFGQALNYIIAKGQPTFIDCFPSGHAGISILVTYWLFRSKNHYRYIFLVFCIGMVLATLSLRYHYFLDVIASIPLATISFVLAKKLLPLPIGVREKRKWRF